jgi:L-fucose mutarotase
MCRWHQNSTFTGRHLPLFGLDTYFPCPLVMMAAVIGDLSDPKVKEEYLKAIYKTNPDTPAIERIDRFVF